MTFSRAENFYTAPATLTPATPRILWMSNPEGGAARAHDGYLNIGTVAARFNITTRTLRFYESKGLISPLRNGQARLYAARDLVRLELVLKGKHLGFTLSEIIAMLGPGPESASTDLVMSKDQLLAKMKFLEEQHRALEQALAELRKRYYLMSEAVSECGATDAIVAETGLG